MRRTVRPPRRTLRALTVATLTVAALTGAALAAAAPAGVAAPAAEVSPGTVQPGGTVTVTVSCGPTDGPAPETVEATSAAFDDVTVELRRTPGGDGEGAGPAGPAGPVYRGSARIAPESDLRDVHGAGSDTAWSAGPDTAWPVSPDTAWSAGPDTAWPVSPDTAWSPGPDTAWSASPDTAWSAGPDTAWPADRGAAGPADGGAGRGAAWTVDGTCPAPPGGRGEPWSATFDVRRDGAGSRTPCPEPHGSSCGAAVLEHGARAGVGGAFAGSVPALVAGGLLVAAAAGAAAHRLRHRGHYAGR
ncbi:hypothetical protein ACL02U_00050 [Streptomyces sp. MS06]|uniref:hypothetical protein n=1 Tax=Streptomyces sp. MS06 TaxID=3385974 RepID=UPI0039A33AD7